MDKRGWTKKLPKWLLSWMASLLPTQSSSGDRAMNIGQVNGDVHHVTHNVSQRPVTMHVTQVFYSAQVQAQQSAANSGVANEAQREVLALLRQLSEGAKLRVLNHMDKKYGTKKVVDVNGSELKNLKRYMEVTLQNERRKA
ncbi:MAG: hypothetical protein RSD57_00085 [Comamonas sp.]